MGSHFHKPSYFIDIFLQPGEFYFGDRESRIRTLLGSCVAITMWHPRLHIGGMCHYLLPMCHDSHHRAEPDGRYADDAMMLFMRELKKTGTWPGDYEVKIFGGGNQFPNHAKGRVMSVPDKNIHFGLNTLTHHGFTIKAQHVGGNGYRNVIFDVWSGEVWIKHVNNQVMGAAI